MKRKLVILALAVLLLSMIGATMAEPIERTWIVWGMDADGNMMRGGFGIVAFNTQSGAWFLTTFRRTLYSDGGLYSFGITTSKPVTGVAPDVTYILAHIYDDDGDGHIDLSGTVSDSAILFEINQNIANDGVFILGANSV